MIYFWQRTRQGFSTLLFLDQIAVSCSFSTFLLSLTGGSSQFGTDYIFTADDGKAVGTKIWNRRCEAQAVSVVWRASLLGSGQNQRLGYKASFLAEISLAGNAWPCLVLLLGYKTAVDGPHMPLGTTSSRQPGDAV